MGTWNPPRGQSARAPFYCHGCGADETAGTHCTCNPAMYAAVHVRHAADFAHTCSFCDSRCEMCRVRPQAGRGVYYCTRCADLFRPSNIRSDLASKT